MKLKASAVHALSKTRWVRLFDSLDLEVLLCPSAMPDITARIFGFAGDKSDVTICQEAFLDFRNYVDDKDKPIKNTLEVRLQLFRTPIIGQAINNALSTANNEILAGEASAASG